MLFVFGVPPLVFLTVLFLWFFVHNRSEKVREFWPAYLWLLGATVFSAAWAAFAIGAVLSNGHLLPFAGSMSQTLGLTIVGVGALLLQGFYVAVVAWVFDVIVRRRRNAVKLEGLPRMLALGVFAIVVVIAIAFALSLSR